MHLWSIGLYNADDIGATEVLLIDDFQVYADISAF